MTAADFFALLAVIVSVFTFFWTNHIEHRLSKKADARYAFDGLVSVPLEAKLASLEAVMGELTLLVIDTAGDEERDQAVSRLLKRSYTPWYVATDGMLNAALAEASVADLETVIGALSDYQDMLSPILDSVSGPLNEAGRADNAHQLTNVTAGFIGHVRAAIHQMRLRY